MVLTKQYNIGGILALARLIISKNKGSDLLFCYWATLKLDTHLGTWNTKHVFNTRIIKFTTSIGVLPTSINGVK